MQSKKESEKYTKIQFYTLEKNSQIYNRLFADFDKKLNAFDEKLQNQLKADSTISDEQKSAISNQSNEIYASSKNMIQYIRAYQKYSEPDAIQVLARVGMALDNPQDEDNLKQLSLLIDKLGAVKRMDAGQEPIAAARARKALAVSLATWVVGIGLIAIAVMFPPAILILAPLAGISTGVGYVHSRYINEINAQDEELAIRQWEHENKVTADAQSLSKTSGRILDSFKGLKEKLPKDDVEVDSKNNKKTP